MRTRWAIGGVVLLLVMAIGAWAFVGVYTIQPIGALPEGITLVIWRASSEPFFNSPDATCLVVQGSVSLFCRMLAMTKAAPHQRIIFRLPYSHMAYLWSTGGQSFDR